MTPCRGCVVALLLRTCTGAILIAEAVSEAGKETCVEQQCTAPKEDPLPEELLARLSKVGVQVEVDQSQSDVLRNLLGKAIHQKVTTQKAADVLRRNVRLGKATSQKYIETWSNVLQRKMDREAKRARADVEEEDVWEEEYEEEITYNEKGERTEVIWEGSGKEMREKMARKRGESPLRDDLVAHLNQSVIDQTPYNWSLMTQMVLGYRDELTRQYGDTFPVEVTAGIERVIHPDTGMSILAYAVALARQEGASDFVNALLDRGADPNLQTGTTTPFLEACSHNHLILAVKMLNMPNGSKPLAGKRSLRGVGVDIPFRFFDQMALELEEEITMRQLHPASRHDLEWTVKSRPGLTPTLAEWKSHSPTLVKLLTGVGKIYDIHPADPDAIAAQVLQSVQEWYHPLLHSWLRRCAGKCDLNRQVAGWISLYGSGGGFNNTLAHLLGRNADDAGIEILSKAVPKGFDLTRLDSNGRTAHELAAMGGYFTAAKAIASQGVKDGGEAAGGEAATAASPAHQKLKEISDRRRRADLQQDDPEGGWGAAFADLPRITTEGCDIDEEDADELDAHTFLYKYLLPRRPVVVRGATTNWEWVDSWRRKPFLKKFGGERFNVSQTVYHGRGPFCNRPTRTVQTEEFFCPPENATALEATTSNYRAITISEFVSAMDAAVATSRKAKNGALTQATAIPQPTKSPWPDLLISRELPTRVSRGFLRGVEGIPTILAWVDDAMRENSTSMYLPRSVEFVLGPPWAGIGPQRFFHSWSGLAFGRQQWYLWPPGTRPKTTVDSAVGSSVAAWLASHSNNGVTSAQETLSVVQNAGDIVYIPERWSAANVLLQPSIGIVEAFAPQFFPQRASSMFEDPRGEKLEKKIRVRDA